MGRVHERQRWLAGLAMVAAAPLPFTGVATWPVVGVFAVTATWLLISRRPVGPVPTWVENVLAPVVVFVVVALGGIQFGVLRPISHMALLVAAIRLPGSARRRPSGLLTMLLGVIGVAAVASSTHVTLIPFMVVAVALIVTAVARMDMLEFAKSDKPRQWPPWRMTAATVVLASLFAAPLFVVLPRLRSPFAVASMGVVPVSGFRGTVELNNVGSIKESRAVALRVRPVVVDGEPREWLRLAGSTSQHYRAGRWLESRRPAVASPARPPGGGRLQQLEITLEKSSDRYFVPPGTVSVTSLAGSQTWTSDLGDVLTRGRVDSPADYAVSFVGRRIAGAAPSADDVKIPETFDDISTLARTVTAGAANAADSARRLEVFLRSNFAYTTVLDQPLSVDPIRWFLLRSRRGHCEYFASGMVIMLRSVGVPARLQTGYLGGDLTSEGDFLVRDSNAHAWVLAWVDGQWRVFDPTPAEGRPSTGTSLSGLRLSQVWEQLEQVWDRWILTFSIVDQLQVLVRGGTWVRGHVGVAALAGLIVLLAVGAGPSISRKLGLLLARRRSSRDVLVSGIERVSEAARRRGFLSAVSVTPRELAQQVGTRVPEAAPPVEWLVREHERYRYGGGEAPDPRRVGTAAAVVVRRINESTGTHRPGDDALRGRKAGVSPPVAVRGRGAPSTKQVRRP